MKIKDCWENFYMYTGKASEIVRQLGFVGIAIIWVFKTDLGGKQIVPSELSPAAIFIVVGLGLDLMQYIAGALVWGIYTRRKETTLSREKKEKNENPLSIEADEFLAPDRINWLASFLFWGKILVMVIAYVYLFRFLVSRVF
jgi:hypothetical protein